MKQSNPKRTIAQRQVAKWIRHNDGAVFNLAVKRHALKKGKKAIFGLSGVEEDSITELSGFSDFFTTLTQTVKEVIPTVVQYRTSNKILEAQLKRGEQGLPPLNVQDYSPVLRVSPTFDPQSEAALTRVATQTAGSTIQRFALPIALGAGALFLLLRKKRR